MPRTHIAYEMRLDIIVPCDEDGFPSYTRRELERKVLAELAHAFKRYVEFDGEIMSETTPEPQS